MTKANFFSRFPLQNFFILLIILAVGIALGQKFTPNIQNNPQANIEKNTQKAFVSEIYDKIKENYWDNIADAALLELFKLSMDKNGASITVAKFDNKDKMLESFAKATSALTAEQKNQVTVAVASSVLASLNPAGRSGLFTQKQEETLKNTVNNINPEKDLYKDLGLNKGATAAAVEQAFQQQAATASAEKLKQLSYAKETLVKPETKQRYDQNGIEPTIFAKFAGPGVLYVQFKKFSPTSFDEFQKVFESYKDTTNLNSLIFDLRGNVGGAIDATSYFLGNFLGKGQYAFDFYHKGEYLPFKTPTDKIASLIKYKQVVIMVDNQTQSSAEMMAASLKKYHVGVVIGVPTKGWGTVEKVFPLDNQFDPKQKYSMFLVHSITLRDDNQPIEGRGVDPDININNSSWETQLYSYFHNQQLIDAIREVLSNKYE